jgi:putative FmdB family regulatory protein
VYLWVFYFCPEGEENMPTYDYKCPECGHAEERFHGIKEVLEIKCPSCEGAILEKLISGGAGIVFKGEGWTPTFHNRAGKKPKKSTS